MMYLQFTLTVVLFLIFCWQIYRTVREQDKGDYTKATYEMAWAIATYMVLMSLK